MTIAATLSRKLYETFGDEAAGAMVDWMRGVNAQRTELRELNDLGFARIDARFGEARAERDLRFAELSARLDVTRAELNGRIDALRSELGEKIATRYGDLLKWSFVFWATTMVALFLRTR